MRIRCGIALQFTTAPSRRPVINGRPVGLTADRISSHTYHSRLDLHVHVGAHAPPVLAQHRRAQEHVGAAPVAALLAGQAGHLVDGVDRRLGGRLVQLAHIVRPGAGGKEAGFDALHRTEVVLDLHKGGQVTFGCEVGGEKSKRSYWMCGMNTENTVSGSDNIVGLRISHA